MAQSKTGRKQTYGGQKTEIFLLQSPSAAMSHDVGGAWCLASQSPTTRSSRFTRDDKHCGLTQELSEKRGASSITPIWLSLHLFPREMKNTPLLSVCITWRSSREKQPWSSVSLWHRPFLPFSFGSYRQLAKLAVTYPRPRVEVPWVICMLAWARFFLCFLTFFFIVPVWCPSGRFPNMRHHE